MISSCLNIQKNTLRNRDMDMKLTVAICTYRRFDWLEKCISALELQTLSQKDFHILVVDNSLQFDKSENFKKECCSNIDVEYIITDKSGLSYARNVALKQCRTPYIAYLDDDALAEPGWAEAVLDAFEACGKDTGVVGGKVNPIWEISKPEWLDGELLGPLTVLDWGDSVHRLKPSEWLVGANVAYKTSALAAVGGFSEQLGRKGNILLCHEELQVNNAIVDMGYAAVYTPYAVVDHLVQKERMKQDWLCLQAFWESISRAVYVTGVNVDPILSDLEKAVASRLEEMMRNFTPKETTQGVVSDMRRFSEAGKQVMNEAGIVGNSHRAAPQYPLICVVTPCLDAADTIDETIESVVSQAGDFYIRYHVQDGGSKDATIEKLKRWERRLEENADLCASRGILFTFSSNADSGMYEAVGTGFKDMSMPDDAIMTWINANDIIGNSSFAKVVAGFSKYPDIHWLGGGIHVIGVAGETKLKRAWGFPAEVVKKGLCDGQHWQCLQQEGLFWRKWLWDKVGGVDNSFKFAGDWDLWRRFSQHAEFVRTEEILGSFRVMDGQLSTQGDSYAAEINATLPVHVRAKAAKGLPKKYSELAETVLYFDASNRPSELKRQSLTWDALPDQARARFSDGDVVSDEQTGGGEYVPSHYEDPGAVVMRQSKSFLEWPILHTIYLKMPPQIRTFLSFVKYKGVLPVSQLLKVWKAWVTISRSGLFWPAYYLTEYPDVRESGLHPLLHFLQHGAVEGRNPNPLFITNWYIEKNDDVRISGVNPLVHYYRYGWKEGRDPGPNFSSREYLEKNDDVRKREMNPLAHYLTHGLYEGR